MNKLLQHFQTPFQTIPFNDVQVEDFLPALTQAMESARLAVDELVSSAEAPSFANTIEKLDVLTDQIDFVANVFYNLHSAETNDSMQAIAEEFGRHLTEFYSDMYLNQRLFERIRSVYESAGDLELDDEAGHLLESTFKSFTRNGALLNDEDKKTLRELDTELSRLSLQFGDNVLEELNSFELVIEDKADLEGLPDNVVAAAAEAAAERGKEGVWLFTLDAPSMQPFLKFADRRDLREQLMKAFSTVASRSNEHDNRGIVKDIAHLRYRRARLLGFESHAHFVLAERMARTPENVSTFLDELFEKAKDKAAGEVAELENIQHEIDGRRDLQRWDYAYFAEKHRKRILDIDENALRPYFQLERCIEGMFTVANKLYGLTFERRMDIEVYHRDVHVYKVSNEADGSLVGILYADFFPRAGKRNGAWMTTYRSQCLRNGQDQRPHISIVCNFTPPSSGKPALLSFDEVNTLFHEFGHALHGLLSNCRYRQHSGVSVYRDFVELPSQVMECWLTERECLDLFAAHYESGEKLPAELVEKIQKSEKMNQGYAILRQISLGVLDLSWHTRSSDEVHDVEQFERDVTRKLEVLPHIAHSNLSCRFSHIFRGGYSAGYYGYKWAEVLAADAFEFFKEAGIFNREIADKFRENILSKGGSVDPMVLYKRFRGREANMDALLRRAGLS